MDDVQKQNVLKFIKERQDLSILDEEACFTVIEEAVDALYPLWMLEERMCLCNEIYAELRGYDVLEPLLHNTAITEIMVNRYDAIYCEERGQLYRTNLQFASPSRYEDILQRIVNMAGREVNQRSPIVDCRMRDGSRVNVVLSPIASHGSALTIRKFRKENFTLEELVELGSLSEEARLFLQSAVQARLNIFISGGTGSGKTTLLNALSREIPASDRLITIEDSRELQFDHAHWIALEARQENAVGSGKISIRDLIRTALRMRPDRIIVGEVRGEEAVDMLQAMNTGHDGSFSTGHANSIPEMQFRLETMVLGGNLQLPLHAIRQQIGAALDLCIQVERTQTGHRRILAIAEVCPQEARIEYHMLFEWKNGKLTWVSKEGMRNRLKFDRAGISWKEPLCD